MADATTKKILSLLTPKHAAEVRAAAAVILGETANLDGDVSDTLCQGLDDADGGVRLRVIEAIGKLKVADALPTLLTRIEKGGDEASESAHAAAKLGARGTKALQELMHKVAPGLRRYIAAALGAAGNASGEAAAIEFLLDKDAGVVESSVRSLIAQVPSLSTAKKQTLTEQLLQLLKSSKTGLPVTSEAAAVRLLAGLGDKRAEPVFWDRVLAPHPAEIRAAALQALGGLSERPGKDHVKRLFTCAIDSDFRLAAPALMMLQQQNVTDKTLDDWLGLFRASDVAVRRLALDKIAGHESADVAEVLLAELRHPDRAYRESVLARLTSFEAGQKALHKALLEAENPDAAWSLARALTPFVKSFPKGLVDKVFAQACAYHEVGDRRAEPFFFFLREADAAKLRDRLEEKAMSARKKKNYEGAVGYLKLLARDPAIGFSIRLELACCGLHVSNKALSPEARANDPSLAAFSHLIAGYEEDTRKSLEKTKWLEPEDLHYLGFHFVEKEGAAKKFGGFVLNLLLKRAGKTKLAKDAKTKLKASGLT